MNGAPLLLAFGAGLVATLNPCGFAMLPAYLGYYVGGDEPRSALRVGATVSAGFLAVFGMSGLIISFGSRAIIAWIPWLALLVGFGVLVLGTVMLLGITPHLALPSLRRSSRERMGMFAFGVSYAIASLSCTLPVFLAVVAAQLTTGSFLGGFATFVAYAAGMSVLLIAVTVAVGLGRDRLLGRMRAVGGRTTRISGAVLVASGGYIVWFWTTALRSGAAATAGVPGFGLVEEASRIALGTVARAPVLWGVALTAVILVGSVRLRRGSDGPPKEDG